MPLVSPVFPRSSRGTVLLVSLCFVTVMGIALGSYLAVCSRAMNLSNRSLQAGLSKQLAEAGIEEALRAFNLNDWSGWSSNPSGITGATAAWTLTSNATTKRATRTINLDSTKFGQGVTATVKLRVDNYNAHVLGSAWSSSKTYRIGDQVGYNGIWYVCVRNHSNQAPNGDISNHWAPEGVSWKWDSTKTYAIEEMVNFNGYWYQCTAINTNSAPTGTATSNANWTYVPAVTKDNTTGVYGVQDAIVNWYGVWWRWHAGVWNNQPPISWRWRNTGTAYSFNNTVCVSNVWYRYISDTPTNTSSTYNQPNSDGSRWELLTNMWLWSSSNINYNIGDVVYHSSTSQWYRCIQAHTSSGSITPTNATHWTNTPALSTQWNVGPHYSANDLVSYNGVWYRCIVSHTSSTSILPTNTSYWIGANTANASYQWNATTAYAAGAYRSYGGVWYRCLVTNTGQSPNNSVFWTPTWTQSSDVSTGAPVVYGEAVVALGDGTNSRTQLRAPVIPASLFPNAVATTSLLTVSSSGGTVDSYDSTLGSYGGANVGFSAVLASTGSSQPAITINNTTTVKGYLNATPAATSPFAPMYSVSTSTTVKGPSPSLPNVDLNQVSRSPYIPNFGIQHVVKGLVLSTFSNVTLGTAGATTPSVYYYTGDMDMDTASENITINGPVILYISGTLRIRQDSGARITINPTGSLRLHVARAFRIESNGGGIVNNTNDPSKLTIYLSRTGNDTFNYSFPHSFYGTIYLPGSSSTFTVGNNVEIFGALSAQNITFSGAANLHYDTSLRHAAIPGVDQPYTVSSWRELPATEPATMP